MMKETLRFLATGPSTNLPLGAWPKNLERLLPADALVYDVGGKDARGRYDGFALPPGARLTVIDIAPGPYVDIVADAHDLHMIADGSADCALLMSVLPHVKRPWVVIDEVHRILKPGGLVAISSAFVYTYSPDPEDYCRFSVLGLESLCQRFEKIASGFNRGPASTMAQLLVHFFALMFCFNNNTLFELNKIGFRYLLFWIKYLDLIVGRFQHARAIHSAAFLVGRKQSP
jgi:SAM-dependent methyltransferase